jgi:ABC-type polysaccharide/polyol phosphate transport system ATPase subunit
MSLDSKGLPEGAVRGDRLWKRFRNDERRWDLSYQARAKIQQWRHRDEAHWRYVLRDVSFEIQPGESVGLVGPNGSGKSTLLKLLTGTMYPYAGTLTVQGRVGALINLQAGIQTQLSGKDNIFLYGSLLGLKRAEVAKKFDQIVEFANLQEAVDRQVKFYSSGMQMRLGFSVACHLDPAVLLVDEVLAVGDATFQQRCLNRMQEVVQSGTTLVLVSHDLAAVEGTCNRCLWLTDGILLADGPIRDVLGTYRQWIEEIAVQNQGVKGEIEILKATATDGDRGSPRSDEPMEVRLVVHSDRPWEASFHIGVSEGPATPIFVLKYNTHIHEGENEITCVVHHLPLPRGRFYLWVAAKSGPRIDLLPWHPACFFDVIGNKLQPAPRGIIRLSAVQVSGDWTIT